ncbi:hypothetical protein MBLNU230_g3101t1 [Neophaeotheca triangularis]
MSDHHARKRKRNERGPISVDTSKPTAVFKPTRGRSHTLSVALPGSIISNCNTPEQKNALAGQIARACAVFCVDEIIIFDDGQVNKRPPEANGYTAFTDPDFFLHHILSYLETPPHLRKSLFPMHPDLRTAGALPSLDMPHHLRSEEWCAYREGVTIGPGPGDYPSSYVEIGLSQPILVDVGLPENTRVTVKLPEKPVKPADIAGKAVSPDEPREKAGYYWGYSVRQATSLSAIFTECPYDGGYDVSIGTSERGVALTSLSQTHDSAYVEPKWQHLLLVFGGVAGLEAALAADTELQNAGVQEVKEMFDRWVNLVPAQGSRTIRTEEAVWLGLMGTRSLVESRGEQG